MSKKILGKSSIKDLMNIILSNFPKDELTEDEITRQVNREFYDEGGIWIHD